MKNTLRTVLFGILEATIESGNPEARAEAIIIKNSLNRLFALNHLAMAQFDKEGRIVYASRTMLNKLGYTWEEISGKPSTIFIKGPKKLFCASSLPVTDWGKPFQIDAELVTKQKSTFRAHIVGTWIVSGGESYLLATFSKI